MPSYFEKFTGMLPHHLPSETTDKLLTCLEQRGVSFVPVTVSPGWEEFDKVVYDSLIPVLKEYEDWLDELTLPETKDEGYYLIQLRKEQDDHSSPLKLITQTIQASKFPLCVIFFLETIEDGWLKFPQQNLKFSINNQYCVVFPANWTYQFEVDLGAADSGTFISTFVGF